MSGEGDAAIEDSVNSNLDQRIVIKRDTVQSVARSVGAYLDPNQKEKVSENEKSMI